MRLSFDTIDEVKDFVKQLKAARGPKDKEEEAPASGAAPVPLQPPQTTTAASGFPGIGGATQGFPGTGGTFPAGPTGTPPEIMAVVNRIVAKVDASIAIGNSVDAATNWFRSQCGAEAANATLDEIKKHFLPRLPAATLENIAKQMNA